MVLFVGYSEASSMSMCMLMCLLFAIAQSSQAEAFSRPNAQQHNIVCMLYVHVVSSLCPVSFCSPTTLRLPSTTLASGHPSSNPYRSRESFDQLSHVPASTVVKLMALITGLYTVSLYGSPVIWPTNQLGDSQLGNKK